MSMYPLSSSTHDQVMPHESLLHVVRPKLQEIISFRGGLLYDLVKRRLVKRMNKFSTVKVMKRKGSVMLDIAAENYDVKMFRI